MNNYAIIESPAINSRQRMILKGYELHKDVQTLIHKFETQKWGMSKRGREN